MNLKTTLVLVIVLVAGLLLFGLGPSLSPWLGLAGTRSSAGAGSLALLEEELTPEKVTRIEIRQMVLSRDDAGNWSLPGKWPVRKPEVDQLVERLTRLGSRFDPIPLGDSPDLARYGLEPSALEVKVQAGDKEYRLQFGDDPEPTNRFSRPTYLRIGDKPEVIRLAPGLIAAIDKPVDYYQQRRLFPTERVPRDPDSTIMVERLAARSVSAKGAGADFTLTRSGEGKQSTWELTAPLHDRADPDKLRSLLSAVPDLWAEQFVEKPKADLAEYGLKEPEQTLTVQLPAAKEPIVLQIGKVSQSKTRVQMEEPPPFMRGQPPQPKIVQEDYRYAKLKDNSQIFEIKGDKLKDVFAGLDTLRDPRLARFRSEDARKVEITFGGQEIVLEKQGGDWRLRKPLDASAEASKVTDLLTKISDLQARGPDIIDPKDPKEQGFDKPAGSVKVTVEEEIKGENDTKEKKTRSITVVLGNHDKEKKRLFVRADTWSRVNLVEDTLLPLVERQPLAYRGRRVLDFAVADVDRIEVQRAEEKYQLKQAKGTWSLTAPVAADADGEKARQLANDLSLLEAIEYVASSPKPEDLDQAYGLAKPALSAKLTLEGGKPAKTLQLGKQRGGKPEYFARLEGDPAAEVFVVKKEIRDALDRSSLAYRPLQLWSVPQEEIASLKIQRQGDPEYRLTREGTNWRIGGPFDATLNMNVAQTLLGDLATLRCERYEAHATKEPDKYGLDKPYLQLTLVRTAKKPDDGTKKPEEPKKEDPKKEDPKEHVLLIGKQATADSKTRFARLPGSEAVFVVGEVTVQTLDRGALDLLDRNLLSVDAKAIGQVRSARAEGGTLNLARKDGKWEAEAGAVKFTADVGMVNGLLTAWSTLRADRFVAYGDKVDAARYGLDKPAHTITITVPPRPEEKDAKPAEHTLELGKVVEDSKGDRYARLNRGPGIAVLGSAATAELVRSYLDYVDRTMLTLDMSQVTGIQRRMKNADLELAKKDDGWHLVKPVMLQADERVLDRLLEQVSRLRAEKVAAYPAKDLKPFGLDAPEAVVTLRLGGGDAKPSERVLRIGKEFGESGGDRYAMLDGGQTVGVLAGSLVRRLLGDPVQFRDHNVARFADADTAMLSRGPRQAVFAKVEGTWKLTKPVEAEAEQVDLDEFINAVARLRADELVAEKPADLKPYGLDRPEARWRFLSGDKEVLSLEVGGQEKIGGKEGPRCYARLGKGDIVFLLDARLTGRVLGEYRNRSLGASIDAAQVEHVNYGYAQNPFVLEKTDNVWKVQDKPGLAVKTEAVNDALAAIANLKAERTVLDKDADLKLYGLQPPRLVLQVRTRTGAQRSIHIGGFEGESKRYYARVPDGTRQDLFVISVADSARIVRDLSAFTEKLAK